MVIRIMIACFLAAPATSRPEVLSPASSRSLWKKYYEDLHHQFAMNKHGMYERIPGTIYNALKDEKSMAKETLRAKQEAFKREKRGRARKKVLDLMEDDLRQLGAWIRSEQAIPPSYGCLAVLRDLEIGEIGLVTIVKINQVIDKSSARVTINLSPPKRLPESVDVWFDNVDTSMMVDDREALITHPVIVCPNRQYETAMGAVRTVPHIMRFDIDEFMRGLDENEFLNMLRSVHMDKADLVSLALETKKADPDDVVDRVASKIGERLEELIRTSQPAP